MMLIFLTAEPGVGTRVRFDATYESVDRPPAGQNEPPPPPAPGGLSPGGCSLTYTFVYVE